MKIAPFKLPSNDSRVINFTKATVEKAMECASCTPDIEEQVTTLYLNGLQEDEKTFYDSREWTVQDRRTALWWIYVESNIDLSLTALYQCERCTEIAKAEYEKKIAAGENAKFQPVDHAIDYNATEYADGLTYLPVMPYQETKHTFNGVEKNVRLLLLNGRAAEELETLRNLVDSVPDDPGFEREKKDAIGKLRMGRLCYQFSVEGEPESFSDAIEYRYGLLNGMSAGDEFKSLVAKIHLMNRELAHGLDISVRDGVSRIRIPRTHVCPRYYELSEEQRAKEAKANYTIKLWLNFRNSKLFPNLRLEGLADFDS